MKIILTALMLTVGLPTWAANSAPPVTVANPSLNVNVTNNPLPVTVTNATTNQSVTITNPVTNPVNTKDAFARTPVILSVDTGEYVVPDGFRLVVDFISLYMECPAADTAVLAELPAIHQVAPGQFLGHNLELVVHSQGFSNSTLGNFSVNVASQSIHFSLEPGDKLGKTIANCIPSQSPHTLIASVTGYLISVNSPSLAP